MRRNRANAEMDSAQILLLYFFLLFSPSCAEFSTRVGINYGLLGNNLPSPSKSVKLIQSLKANRVKLYEPNPEILKALSGKKLQVSVMVPNQLITNISSNQTLSDQWVETNIVPYYPRTLIRYLLVGNEVLSFFSDQDKVTWHNLVPALRRIRASLKTHNIRKVKVGTPLAMDVLGSSFPPSNGTFRSDVAESVVRPLLQFINRTKSFFFLDVYPYFVWSQNYQTVDLDYALFETKDVTYTDPKTSLVYRNVLDQMLDAVFFAMDQLGFPKTRLWICETGWPNAGDVDQIGANIYNAATYNRNLVKRLTTKPAIGTPARPGLALPAFIFSLYNENQKGGPGTERHWGLFYPNGSNVYPIDFSGEVSDYSGYPPLPKAENNKPYKGKIWCVVAKGANLTDLGSALAFACGQGNGTCEPIQPGKECYKPDSLVWHASYAFSSYWVQFRSGGGTCYFNGLAVQTTRDPSKISLSLSLSLWVFGW